MATAPQHVTALESVNRDVSAWVDEVAKLTQPERVYWCDGSQAEFQRLQRELIASKELLPLELAELPRLRSVAFESRRTWRASSI